MPAETVKTPVRRLRVLLADDHQLILDGVRHALEESVYTAIGLPDDPSSRAAKAAGLTERELAILTALARGMSNAAIAKQLWVAQQTVKFHLTNIYRKLGVANRTEAARYAYQQGLIESPLHEDEGSPLK